MRTLFADLTRMLQAGADDVAIMSRIRTHLNRQGFTTESEKPTEFFGVVFTTEKFTSPEEDLTEVDLLDKDIQVTQHWIGITVNKMNLEMTFEGKFWTFGLLTEDWYNKITEIVTAIY